jgi:hypothetical protein
MFDIDIQWQFGRANNFLGGEVPLTFKLANKNPCIQINFSEYFLHSPGDGKYFGKTTQYIGSFVDRASIEVILKPAYNVGLEDLPESITFHLKRLIDEEIVNSVEVKFSMGQNALIFQL